MWIQKFIASLNSKLQNIIYCSPCLPSLYTYQKGERKKKRKAVDCQEKSCWTNFLYKLFSNSSKRGQKAFPGHVPEKKCKLSFKSLEQKFTHQIKLLVRPNLLCRAWSSLLFKKGQCLALFGIDSAFFLVFFRAHWDLYLGCSNVIEACTGHFKVQSTLFSSYSSPCWLMKRLFFSSWFTSWAHVMGTRCQCIKYAGSNPLKDVQRTLMHTLYVHLHNLHFLTIRHCSQGFT